MIIYDFVRVYHLYLEKLQALLFLTNNLLLLSIEKQQAISVIFVPTVKRI